MLQRDDRDRHRSNPARGGGGRAETFGEHCWKHKFQTAVNRLWLVPSVGCRAGNLRPPILKAEDWRARNLTRGLLCIPPGTVSPLEGPQRCYYLLGSHTSGL